MEPWEEGPSTGVGGALAITMEEMGTWEGSGQKRGGDFLDLYRIPHWTLGHRCGAWEMDRSQKNREEVSHAGWAQG